MTPITIGLDLPARLVAKTEGLPFRMPLCREKSCRLDDRQTKTCSLAHSPRIQHTSRLIHSLSAGHGGLLHRGKLIDSWLNTLPPTSGASQAWPGCQVHRAIASSQIRHDSSDRASLGILGIERFNTQDRTSSLPRHKQPESIQRHTWGVASISAGAERSTPTLSSVRLSRC